MQKVLNTAIKRPFIVITLWLVAIILIAINLKPFKMLITIDGLINKNFETAIAYRNLKSTFEEGTPLVILHNHELSGEKLCLLRSWLSNLPKANQHLIKTHSLFSLRRPHLIRKEKTFDQLVFPQLIDLRCSPTPLLNYDAQELEQSPWNGLLVQRDSFLTELRFSSLGEMNFDSKEVPKIVEKLWQNYPVPLKTSSLLFGEAAYQYFMKEGLKKNNLLNGVLLLLVVLLMRLFLGTWRSGFIFIGTLITCALFLFGLMNISGSPLDVLNNSLFILLSVASLGDFIFICHHQRKEEAPWQESFKALIRPSFFTSLTTFLGFISLTTSDLTIVKRLGFWAAMSGVIEWLVLFTLLPALLSLFKFNSSLSNRTHSFGTSLFKKLEQLEFGKASLVFFFLVYLGAPLSPLFFNINDNPTLLFPDNHPFRQAIGQLKESMGFSGEVSLVVPRTFSEKEDNNRLITLKTAFEGLENVSKVESPLELTDYFTHGFDKMEQDLILSSIKKTSAYTRLVQDGSYRLRIYLKETSLKDINNLRLKVKSELCPNSQCELTGALVAYAEFSQRVPRTLLISLGTSLFLVALIMTLLWLFYKSRHQVPLMPLLISGFWGVAFVLLIIALSQFKLNFVTCVVLAILVGMTGDNAIHYLLAADGSIQEGISHKQGASILTTTIMSSCCMIFFFFSFEPPRVLGLLLIIGLWGSLVGDLWFLKLLLRRKIDKKKPTSEGRPFKN